MAITQAKRESVEKIQAGLGQQFNDPDRLSISTLKSLAYGIETLKTIAAGSVESTGQGDTEASEPRAAAGVSAGADVE